MILFILFFICATFLSSPHLPALELTEQRLKRLENQEILRWIETNHESKNAGGVSTALAVVKGTKEEVRNVIWDVANYSKFMPNTESIRMLEETSETKHYFTKIDMPWPLSDVKYECKLSSYGKGEDGALELPFQMVPGTGDGVKTFQGKWRLTSFAENQSQTLVEYQLLFEPASWYPGWAQRIGLNATLPEVMKAIRKRVSEEKNATEP